MRSILGIERERKCGNVDILRHQWRLWLKSNIDQALFLLSGRKGDRSGARAMQLLIENHVYGLENVKLVYRVTSEPPTEAIGMLASIDTI